MIRKCPAIVEVASQFVCEFVEFCTFSKIQFKISYREEFNRCLKLLRIFQLWGLVTKRCLSSHEHFFESVAETNGACNGLK